jgi:NAD-dependent dihydropyrimidine dehydrogenase PreA subunit
MSTPFRLAVDPNMPAVDPAAMLPPDLRRSYAELRQLPFFDGVPNDLLVGALTSQDLALHTIDRDHIVADPTSVPRGEPAPVLYLVSGQIAAGVFEPHELSERKQLQDRLEGMTPDEREAESIIKPLPMARLARKNVALFAEGDVFNTGALSAARGAPVAFFTTAPASVVFLAQRLVADIAVRFPFFEARFRRAIQASRQRLHGVTGVKQEVLDFFVRQGISVSGESVRVRQLDSCIDCKQCEIACEERYGVRRLTLGGYQLGMLPLPKQSRHASNEEHGQGRGHEEVDPHPDHVKIEIAADVTLDRRQRHVLHEQQRVPRAAQPPDQPRIAGRQRGGRQRDRHEVQRNERVRGATG